MDQDIPLNHILNVLNDFCIQQIISRLDDIGDFLSVAEVCVRFQSNAKACIPQHWRKVSIFEDKWVTKSRDGHTRSRQSLQRLCRYLHIFAQSIQSIMWDDTESDRLNTIETIDRISFYCGEHLTSLTISGCGKFLKASRSSFQALEQLAISSVELQHFNCSNKLTKLKLFNVSMQKTAWLEHEYPNLTDVDFNDVHGLEGDGLIKFIRCNPQIRTLKLHPIRTSQSVLDNIGVRLTCLESLNIFIDVNFRSANVTVLGGLHQLRNLDLICNVRGMSARNLIDSFVENRIPLESLSILAATDCISSLVELKTIKELSIHDISDDLLLQIVRNLPILQSLNVYSDTVTIHGIKNALGSGRNGQRLFFQTDFRALDENDYRTCLHFARVQSILVTIRMRQPAQVNLPKVTLDSNKQWVSIC
ncbi:hypothetical protein HA402_007188 [Bradysia odoriphaga]|nr:hypothetical protein HA402_007188 [Bradysia odoriphaga]